MNFAADAVAMYPLPMPTVGQEANQEAWQKVYSDPGVEHPVTVDEVYTANSGELGYSNGRWWYRNYDKKINSGGRYVAVWKVIDKEWKIVMLSANRHSDIATDTSSF